MARTHTQTDGHSDFETEPAQWADAVKISCLPRKLIHQQLYEN